MNYKNRPKTNKRTAAAIQGITKKERKKKTENYELLCRRVVKKNIKFHSKEIQAFF